MPDESIRPVHASIAASSIIACGLALLSMGGAALAWWVPLVVWAALAACVGWLYWAVLPAIRRHRAVEWFRAWTARATAVNTSQHLPEEVVAAAPEPPLEPVPHDPDKTYTGTPSHKVSGEGRFRAIEATLDKVGSGYDTGVTLEIVRPDGQPFRFSWEGMDHPRTRREVRDNGSGIWAPDEGPYTIRWWSRPPPGYAPELIVEEEVPLGPTGPRDGWIARHSWRDDEIVFEVAQESSGQEQLHGFRCQILGPSPLVPFEADHRSQEKTFGPPSPKAKGSFVFPRDFSDAPAVQDLHDGDYAVYWTAWDVPGESGRPTTQLDVARDAFHVTREGSVE